MSNPPIPPGRSEPKYRLSSSFESVGPCSLNVVLIVEPRFAGSDHVEKCAVGFTTRFAVMLRSDSVPQARSSASEATAASIRDARVIDPPSLHESLPARLTRRHPEILHAKAARPDRREDQ